jgi:hypothetical protein
LLDVFGNFVKTDILFTNRFGAALLNPLFSEPAIG